MLISIIVVIIVMFLAFINTIDIANDDRDEKAKVTSWIIGGIVIAWLLFRIIFKA